MGLTHGRGMNNRRCDLGEFVARRSRLLLRPAGLCDEQARLMRKRGDGRLDVSYELGSGNHADGGSVPGARVEPFTRDRDQ